MIGIRLAFLTLAILLFILAYMSSEHWGWHIAVTTVFAGCSGGLIVSAIFPRGVFHDD